MGFIKPLKNNVQKEFADKIDNTCVVNFNSIKELKEYAKEYNAKIAIFETKLDSEIETYERIEVNSTIESLILSQIDTWETPLFKVEDGTNTLLVLGCVNESDVEYLKKKYNRLYQWFVEVGLIVDGKLTIQGQLLLLQLDIEDDGFDEDKVLAFLKLFYGKIERCKIGLPLINESFYGDYENSDEFIEDIIFENFVTETSEKLVPFIDYEAFYTWYKRNNKVEVCDGYYFDGNYVYSY